MGLLIIMAMGSTLVLTFGWISLTIVIVGVGGYLAAYALGFICPTCFNRGYLPIFNKRSRAFDLRMACPSCKEMHP